MIGTQPNPAFLGSQPRVAHTLRFSLQCRIPIPVKATVDVAARFRQSAIKRFKESCGEDAHSFALSGHEPIPKGVEGDHQHANFLPVPWDFTSGNAIEEIHIWAPCGFTQTEVEALMRVKTVHWSPSKYPIRPILTSIDQQKPAFLSVNPAKVWHSLTPYVPPRHFYRGNLHRAKLKQKDSPEVQLAADLDRLGIRRPLEIHRIPIDPKSSADHPPQIAWEIVRTPGNNPAFDNSIAAETRSTKGKYERRIGFFFQLSFDHPIEIHRPLGHSSHFGLGLFVPTIEKP